MTTFTDGPAAGTTLALARAPLFLRVVEGPDGKIDALDKLDDKPAVDEKVFAYLKTEDKGGVHLCRGGGRGGYYAMATYRLCERQPDAEILRSKAQWQAWAFIQAKELEAAKEKQP